MQHNRKPPRMVQADNGKWYVYYSKNERSQRFSLRTNDLQEAEARFDGWLKKIKQAEKLAEIHHDPTIAFCLWKSGLKIG